MTWHLRGFDRRTDLPRVDFEFRREMLPRVRPVLPDAKNDPDLMRRYGLTKDQTVRLSEALGIAIAPDRFGHAVEAEDDCRAAQAERDRT